MPSLLSFLLPFFSPGLHLFDAAEYAENADLNGLDTRFFNIGSFWTWCLQLYIATTTENYPDVVWPMVTLHPENAATAGRQGPYNALAVYFWISFMLLSMFILANIAVPLIYEPFKERQKQQLLNDQLEQRKALARRGSAEHLIATKALLRLHSHGLDAHCR